MVTKIPQNTVLNKLTVAQFVQEYSAI